MHEVTWFNEPEAIELNQANEDNEYDDDDDDDDDYDDETDLRHGVLRRWIVHESRCAFPDLGQSRAG
jgi:hypothetical protein